MKKLVLIMMTILLSVSLIGCRSIAANAAIESGKLELEKKEYIAALFFFNHAVDEGSEDQEVKK